MQCHVTTPHHPPPAYTRTLHKAKLSWNSIASNKLYRYTVIYLAWSHLLLRVDGVQMCAWTNHILLPVEFLIY